MRFRKLCDFRCRIFHWFNNQPTSLSNRNSGPVLYVQNVKRFGNWYSHCVYVSLLTTSVFLDLHKKHEGIRHRKWSFRHRICKVGNSTSDSKGKEIGFRRLLPELLLFPLLLRSHIVVRFLTSSIYH